MKFSFFRNFYFGELTSDSCVESDFLFFLLKHFCWIWNNIFMEVYFFSFFFCWFAWWDFIANKFFSLKFFLIACFYNDLNFMRLWISKLSLLLLWKRKKLWLLENWLFYLNSRKMLKIPVKKLYNTFVLLLKNHVGLLSFYFSEKHFVNLKLFYLEI